MNSSANSSDEARLDVSCARGKRAFLILGFLILSQRATLTRNLTRPSQATKIGKTRLCNQTVIEVEHGSLTPLVFLPYGGKRQRSRAISSRTSTEAIKEETA